MSNKTELEQLQYLLDEGLIGIDSGNFVVDQSALLSAMEKTDRLLLIRILSKLEKVDAVQLLNESIDLDKNHLADLLNSQPKYIKEP